MTTVSPEIIKRVEDKILEVLTILQKRYNTVLEIPKYSFRQMGTKGGLAYYRDYRIELNSDFFKNYAEEMINQVVPHEIAHLVSFKVYGILGQGHGRFWKGVMSALRPIGVEVTRCHSFSLEGVKHRRVAKPYEYACKCSVHKITLNLHTKMQKGRTYTCRKCRTRLTLKGIGGQIIPLPTVVKVIGPAVLTHKEQQEAMYELLGGNPSFAEQAS